MKDSEVRSLALRNTYIRFLIHTRIRDQWFTVSQLSSRWYYLGNKGENPDDIVDGVGEEAAEDVPLAVDLSGVDFVEEGHHHKSVEHYGEVN